MSEGHQACFGGTGACEGNKAFNEAVTLGTAVATVMGVTEARSARAGLEA